MKQLVILIVGVLLCSMLISAQESNTVPEKAVDYYEKAQKAMQEKDYAKALKYYQKSLDKCQMYFECLRDYGKLKAMIFIGQIQKDPKYPGQEGKEAMDLLERAFKQNPEDMQVLTLLSQMYAVEPTLKDITKAKEFIMKAIALTPADMKLNQFALSMMDINTDLGYLQQIYKNMVTIEPANVQYLAQYFDIANRVKDADEMIWALEKLVEVKKDNLKDLRNLVVLYIQNNKKDKAIKALEELSKRAGDDKDLLTVVAYGYRAFKDFEKALEPAKKLYTMNKNNKTAFEYALVAEALKKNDEAITAYTFVADSKDAFDYKTDAMRSLINLLLDKKEYKTAMKYCDMYLKDYPNDKYLDEVKALKADIQKNM